MEKSLIGPSYPPAAHKKGLQEVGSRRSGWNTPETWVMYSPTGWNRRVQGVPHGGLRKAEAEALGAV